MCIFRINFVQIKIFTVVFLPRWCSSVVMHYTHSFLQRDSIWKSIKRMSFKIKNMPGKMERSVIPCSNSTEKFNIFLSADWNPRWFLTEHPFFYPWHISLLFTNYGEFLIALPPPMNCSLQILVALYPYTVSTPYFRFCLCCSAREQ